MASIDLIPHDYRVLQGQLRDLRLAGLCLAVVFLFVVGGSYVVAHAADTSARSAADLRVRNAITQQQQEQLQSMRTQQEEYERQWVLLRGLRAGAATEDIFRIVDEAVAGNRVWFDEWSFQRAGVLVDGQKQDVDTGYFVLVSESADQSSHDYRVETHMTIRGQAEDHQALSGFIRALFGQQLIQDVRVRRTTRTELGGRAVVDFDLTVALNSASTDP